MTKTLRGIPALTQFDRDYIRENSHNTTISIMRQKLNRSPQTIEAYCVQEGLPIFRKKKNTKGAKVRKIEEGYFDVWEMDNWLIY